MLPTGVESLQDIRGVVMAHDIKENLYSKMFMYREPQGLQFMLLIPIFSFQQSLQNFHSPVFTTPHRQGPTCPQPLPFTNLQLVFEIVLWVQKILVSTLRKIYLLATISLGTVLVMVASWALCTTKTEGWVVARNLDVYARGIVFPASWTTAEAC